MNHETATAEIMRLWKLASLSGALATLPTEYENRRFKRPDAGPWGRLTLRKAQSTPRNIGDGLRVERTPFVLYLQIFIPEGEGTRVAEQAHDRLKILNYQATYTPGCAVFLEVASMEAVPEPAGSGFVSFNCSIPGHYDIETLKATFDPEPVAGGEDPQAAG